MGSSGPIRPPPTRRVNGDQRDDNEDHHRARSSQADQPSVVGSTVHGQAPSTTYDCKAQSRDKHGDGGQLRHASVVDWFGNSNCQPPMTASHHLWSMVKAQDSGVDRPSLDQRFSCTGHLSSSSGSTTQRPTSFSESADNGEDGQSMVTAGQVPSSVSSSLDCNGQPTPSRHGARTTNVCHWTTEQPQHLSIKASAGAQQRTTDKASKSITDGGTQEDDTHGHAQREIGSKESRLATLGWSLDFNEVDHFASLDVDSTAQRSTPPAASAKDESSAGHLTNASSGGRKCVSGGSLMDYNRGSERMDLVISSEPPPPHRFTTTTTATTRVLLLLCGVVLS